MKTVIYSLLAIFIFGIIATAFVGKPNKFNIILIEPVDKNASQEMLDQSANIIGNRLKAYSPDKFKISVNQERKLVEISLANTWDINTTASLILQKGKLEFYETYNYKEVTYILKNDTTLLNLLKYKAKNEDISKLGCASKNDISKINSFINSLQLSQTCKFAWSGFNNNSFCLLALKLENGKGALLNGSDIESVKLVYGSKKEPELELIFKNSAVKQWAEITKRNIGKSIAMVLDDNVISYPIVRNEISVGKSQITGDFSKEELNFILSVVSNGELPLDFSIVK